MRQVYSREVVEDLVRLRAFIAEKNPTAAAKVAAAWVARIEQLGQFPQMDIRVERATPPADIRDMVFGNYVVRYSVHDEALAILRIWHHVEDRAGQG